MDNATYRRMRSELGLDWWDDASYLCHQGDPYADVWMEEGLMDDTAPRALPATPAPAPVSDLDPEEIPF